MSEVNCPECESDNVHDHGEAENKRTYDDKQHVYECEDCGVLWKE